MDEIKPHIFGGAWTEVKLDAIADNSDNLAFIVVSQLHPLRFPPHNDYKLNNEMDSAEMTTVNGSVIQ